MRQLSDIRFPGLLDTSARASHLSVSNTNGLSAQLASAEPETEVDGTKQAETAAYQADQTPDITPFPSRVLHLFPRLSLMKPTQPPSSITVKTNPTDDASSHEPPQDRRYQQNNNIRNTAMATRTHSNASIIIGQTRDAMEKAFWGLVMPGIGGIWEWGSAVGSVVSG